MTFSHNCLSLTCHPKMVNKSGFACGHFRTSRDGALLCCTYGFPPVSGEECDYHMWLVLGAITGSGTLHLCSNWVVWSLVARPNPTVRETGRCSLNGCSRKRRTQTLWTLNRLCHGLLWVNKEMCTKVALQDKQKFAGQQCYAQENKIPRDLDDWI